MIAHGKVGATNADFDGFAERRTPRHTDAGAGDNAHLTQPREAGTSGGHSLDDGICANREISKCGGVHESNTVLQLRLCRRTLHEINKNCDSGKCGL